ncbi:MAG: DEAD/DEAH box helicase [Gemmataceae bacterium]|nr:DEAD/DEAH box helicase [Gemmataceae bacterium]
MSFQQLGLPSSLLNNIIRLGFNDPTPIQAQAIPTIRSGSDVIALAQTGTGKTGAFLMPIIEGMLNRPSTGVKALILTPTRELAQQIQDVFRNLSRGLKLRAVVVMGGEAIPLQQRKLREGADLIIATPGRLLAFLREGTLSLQQLRTLVIDEADQMFDMGFIPDVRHIIAQLPKERQTLMFSATMPPELAKIGRSLVREPKQIEIAKQGTLTTTVSHTAYPVPAARKSALLEHLLERLDDPSVLVFTRTKHAAKKLARRLHNAGHDVGELHSNRTPSQRARAMQGFRDRVYRVLVATNIAARGIDIRHVTHVVNFDVPEAPEEYVHRIGRTGRGGDSGQAMIFISPEENGRFSRIERQLGKKIPRLKLDDFDYSTPSSGHLSEDSTSSRREFSSLDDRKSKRDRKPKPQHPLNRVQNESPAPIVGSEKLHQAPDAPTKPARQNHPHPKPRGFNPQLQKKMGEGSRIRQDQRRFSSKKVGAGKKGS